MEHDFIIPSGGTNKILATFSAFSTGDTTQVLINNDTLYISNSKNFTSNDGLVCNLAGAYKIKYTANGSYNDLYLYRNGSTI